MLTVVGADGHGVEIEALVVQHLLVGSVIGLDALNLVLLKESGGLAGDQIASCNDLHVGLLLEGAHVRAGDPAASDKANAQLFGSVNSLCFPDVLKRVQILIQCHVQILLK